MNCSVPDCPKPRHSSGLCSMHASRMKRTGSLEATVLRGADQLEARYWQKVDRRGPDECWPWEAMTADGYGRFRSPAGQLAHRFGWVLANGPVPDGVVIDHTCHDPAVCPGGTTCPHRACQNPAHLTLATPAMNASVERRRTAAWSTHCKAGHPFTERNTYRYVRDGTGRRQCLTCAALRQLKRGPRLEARLAWLAGETDDPGAAPATRLLERTHCSHGHALTPDNLYRRPDRTDSWACLTCRREEARKRQR